MQTRHYTLAALIALFLAVQASAPAPALAHGEMDPQHLEEFHLHLDDYEEEVEELVAEVNSIAEARAGGDRAEAALDELTEHWEEAGVHAAIETKATVAYPDIWQGLVAFRQAVEEERGAEAVRAAAQDLAAALREGYGALRLAASRLEEQGG